MSEKKSEDNFDAELEQIGISLNDLQIIASNQGIPIKVALELFQCKGAISNITFLNRIESHAE